MAKKLFILVNNGGDGSYYPAYTFNQDWINKMKERDNNDELDYERDAGVDGDGFHFDTLTVPDDCTLKSLGIHSDIAERE